jgi:non-ribosomal peptide synthetase component E (peptide arylation enzyme)
LFFSGRTRDLIITRDEAVAPSQIENILLKHPDVRYAAAVITLITLNTVGVSKCSGTMVARAVIVHRVQFFIVCSHFYA